MPPRLPTEEEIAWMREHADDTLIPNIWGCNITCGVLSLAVLISRFWSRSLLNRRLSTEVFDILFVVGWVFYVLFLVSFTATTAHGEGRHIIFVTNGRLLQIWTLVTEVAYYFSMGCIKLSILELYRSIFPSSKLHRAVFGVETFTAGWLISGAVVSIFQCTPIDYGWNPGKSPDGFCINYGLLVLILGAFNIVIDFSILILPIPLVRELQVSKHKRNLLIFTFALGFGACITSIVRLAFSQIVGSTADGSWDNVAPGFVSSVELLVCLLCASIPTYRPLYNRFVRRTFGTTNDSQHSNRAGSKGYPSSHGTKVSSGGAIVTNAPGIHVEDQVELMRYAERNGAWVRVADEDDRTLNTTRSR